MHPVWIPYLAREGGVVIGKNIIDVVSRGEIWCPICRRLANVLLPVVEESCLQRILDGQAEGSADENLSRRRFWDPRKKFVKAIDGFASQVYSAPCYKLSYKLSH